MTAEQSSLRTDVRESLASGEFSAAVLWGALASGLLAIVEYNLTTFASESGSATVSYAPLLGGVVAGLLYAGSRKRARTAGAYASAIPTLVLSATLLGFFLFEAGANEQGPAVVVLFAFGTVIALPAVTAIAAVFGFVSAHVSHWAIEAVFGRRREAEAASGR